MKRFVALMFVLAVLLTACTGDDSSALEQKKQQSDFVAKRLESCVAVPTTCVGSFVIYRGGAIKRIVTGTGNNAGDHTIGVRILESQINRGNLWNVLRISLHGEEQRGAADWQQTAVFYAEQFVFTYKKK